MAGFPRFQRLAVYSLKVLGLALVYHLAARWGLQMAYMQTNTSPVWPPTGIALATLLLFGLDLWPGISLGVLLGSLLTGAPLNLAVGMALGNTLEALAGAYGLQRLIHFHPAIDRVRDAIGLVGFAAACTTISATIGTATLMLTGLGAPESARVIWFTWWVGDLLGALVVAPVVLVWVRPPLFPARQTQVVEGALLLGPLALVTWYVFGFQALGSVLHQAMIYVIFPFMIWAALRLGQRGATLASLLISGIAIWGTAHGTGPLALATKNDSLVLLQVFMGVMSLTALILAAASIERSQATHALHQRVADLATLNESSKNLLDTADSASIYHMVCQLAVTRLGLAAAWLETISRDQSAACPAAAYGISLNTIPALENRWESDMPRAPTEPLVKTLPDPQSTWSGPGACYQAYAAFPLVFGGQTLGLLKLLSADSAAFAAERLPFLQSFANLAAVAIQNNWLFEEVQQTNKQLHALSQRLMKAQEDERLHLSRELHDESGQLLTALSMQLGLLERNAARPDAVQTQLGQLKRTASAIQDNLHKLAVDLRPASLDHLGLVTALQQFAAEFGRQYNISVEFEAVGMGPGRLPREVETALFRVVQESLTNVALHAQATRVDVLIALRNDHVVATIEDNGVGFHSPAPIANSHLGLFGMRERVEMLGGRLAVESAAGRGTTVNVEVPCHD